MAVSNNFQNPIPRMLVVAGPSGAGKTTFLSHLASGALSPDIRSDLPDGSEDWPQVAARSLDNYLRTSSSTDASAISLHYDLNNAVRFAASTFAEEPTGQKLLHAPEVVVVTIEASPERLIAQLAHGLQSRPQQQRAQDNVAFLESYAEPGWLEAQSRSWRDFLDQLAQSGRLTRKIFTVPVGNIDSEHDKEWDFAEGEAYSS